MLQFMTKKPLFVSIGLSLALCVACGGTSDSGNGDPAGSAGTSSPGGSGGSPGGSGPGGGSPGGGSPGGAPSTGSTYSSGIAGDKQVGALTDQEFASMCQKFSDYFSTGAVGAAAEEITCRMGALFVGILAQSDAELQTTCKAVYDQCIAGPTMTEETCNKPDATCTATVAEYDACLNDAGKAFIALPNALPTCDKATLTSLENLDLGSQGESPASCKIVETKCPSAPKPWSLQP
jgi:hypothetical protein